MPIFQRSEKLNSAEDWGFARIDFSARSQESRKLPCGAGTLESMIGGGISASALTDIFGAAGTGKTQFAFQCSALASRSAAEGSGALVAFVDCGGAFRPERIAEIAEERQWGESSTVLDSILVMNARTVSEQILANERILSDPEFSRCRLVVVDDVTRNFVSDYGTEESSELISRQIALLKYLRTLTYLGLRKDAAVLLTNGARARLGAGEVETTGELISQFALFRIHFRKFGDSLIACLLYPCEP